MAKKKAETKPKGERITTVHVFVQRDEQDDNEGVLAFRDQNGTWQPMIAADPARVVSLRPIAAEIVKQTGRPVILVEFQKRKHIETLVPHGAESAGQPHAHVVRGVRMGKPPANGQGAESPADTAPLILDSQGRAMAPRAQEAPDVPVCPNESCGQPLDGADALPLAQNEARIGCSKCMPPGQSDA